MDWYYESESNGRSLGFGLGPVPNVGIKIYQFCTKLEIIPYASLPRLTGKMVDAFECYGFGGLQCLQCLDMGDDSDESVGSIRKRSRRHGQVRSTAGPTN